MNKSLSQHPAVRLEILRGAAREKVRTVDVPTFLIGSASDCDLVLGGPQIPEVVAYLVVRDGVVSIRHLGFTPELHVNGQPQAHRDLCDGDRLRLGSYEFLMHIALGTPRARPDRLSFGQLPVGAWEATAREPEASAIVAQQRLLRDVEAAVSATLGPTTRGPIRIYVDPQTAALGNNQERAAS